MKRSATLACLTTCGLLASCLLSASAQPRDLLVVPGKQIGRIPLGPNGARTLAALPAPNFAEQIWAHHDEKGLLWMSPPPHDSPAPSVKYTTLYVHTTSNSLLEAKPRGGVTIDLVRVTSPRFATQDGLHPGSTLAQILRRYPHARPTGSRLFLYDDQRAGIAFEFAQPPVPATHAIAVMIHPPGNPHLVTEQQVNRVPDGG